MGAAVAARPTSMGRISHAILTVSISADRSKPPRASRISLDLQGLAHGMALAVAHTAFNGGQAGAHVECLEREVRK